MTSIAKPPVRHPGLQRNALGFTIRDYEGAMSTLCAGCGHDSVTAALVQSFWELSLPPHRAAKMSGIGCSSKTTAYFMKQSHGFNSVHGRMPSVTSGASAANRDLTYIGISGDGDSLSIGLGQLSHAIRRNVRMLYVIDNNGVYGLTKGQFSASADVGSTSKGRAGFLGRTNTDQQQRPARDFRQQQAIPRLSTFRHEQFLHVDHKTKLCFKTHPTGLVPVESGFCTTAMATGLGSSPKT